MERFIRSALLIGEDNIKKLANKKVMIFGCGGVGSYVIEGLARTGVNNFILIDNAEISDRIVEELMATNGNVSINIHTHSETKSNALKFAGNKLTTINGIKVGVQRKAAQSGYDGDILSPNLVSEIDSCESIYNAISRCSFYTVRYTKHLFISASLLNISITLMFYI